jgi:hypothetical protein
VIAFRKRGRDLRVCNRESELRRTTVLHSAFVGRIMQTGNNRFVLVMRYRFARRVYERGLLPPAVAAQL